MSPLRVAFITQTYHPVVGGSERQLQKLLPGIVAGGVQPLIVTRGIRGAPSRSTVEGVDVVRFGSNRFGPLGTAAFMVGGLWALYRFRPVVMHAFSLMTPATIAAIYRRLADVPMVLKILRGGREGDLDRVQHKPFYALRRRLLGRAIDAAQVISDEIDAEFEAFGVTRENRHRIVNAVDVQAQSSREADTSLRDEHGIPAEATVFVYVGRLAVEKRIDRLIDAFRQLSGEHPDSYLVIVGDGPERDLVGAAAANDARVIAHGQSDDVAAVLAGASVFVQPSSTEGMSNSMLEAMAAGLPIVATDVGAASELLGDEARGWLIDADDTGQLVAAMKAALDPEQARLRGVAAHRYVEAHHSLSSTATRLADIYRSLADRAG